MEGRNHYGEGECSGFQFVRFDTREEAQADRARQEVERLAAEERERIRQLEEEERRAEQRERFRLLAEARRSGAPPPPGSPVCQHCGSAFFGWSELFSHTGLGCPAAASTSRTQFIR